MSKNVYEPKVGDKVRVLVDKSKWGAPIDVSKQHEIRRVFPLNELNKKSRVSLVETDDERTPKVVFADQIEPWTNAESKQPLSIASYRDLGTQIGALVDEKQRQYGNSFGKCGDFLRLLYPDGIAPDAYGDMLALVRIFDKIVRIANGGHGDNESPYRDIAGYGLLGEMVAMKRKGVDAS